MILLGGSEGGDSLAGIAPLLAAHGFAVLSVAYFGVVGTPRHLVDVPLETIGTALAWFARQPEVDASRIGVLGNSKGGEVAFLAASTYPQVRAVVSVVGAPFAMYGIDVGSVSPNAKGSWSIGGAEVPFVPADAAAAARVHSEIAAGGEVSFGLEADASVTNNAAAVKRATFPLERINGPVFCVGAGDDHVWNSAQYCQMALAYLRAHNHPFPDRSLLFADAGHGVLTFYLPTYGYREFSVGRFTEVDGGTAEADGRATEAAWPAIIRFLRASLAPAT
ncbi:MAG TPA: alpha/beta fold hydrolase [Candidatus Cybelea sp.]